MPQSAKSQDKTGYVASDTWLSNKRLSHRTDKQWTRQKAFTSQFSEGVFWNPGHFLTASGNSVSLAAARAAARGAKFKEPPAKLFERCGRSGNRGCEVPAAWNQSWNSPYMQSPVLTNHHPQFLCSFLVSLEVFFLFLSSSSPQYLNFLSLCSKLWSALKWDENPKLSLGADVCLWLPLFLTVSRLPTQQHRRIQSVLLMVYMCFD